MNRSAGHLEFSNILGAGRVKVIRAKSAPAGATLFAPLSRATPMISKISQVSWLGLEMPHSRIPLVVSQIPARYSKLAGEGGSVARYPVPTRAFTFLLLAPICNNIPPRGKGDPKFWAVAMAACPGAAWAPSAMRLVGTRLEKLHAAARWGTQGGPRHK